MQSRLEKIHKTIVDYSLAVAVACSEIEYSTVQNIIVEYNTVE